jgi:hypothetical protein
MAITPKGIVYPTSSDQITPLESVFAAMATSVDEAIPLSGSYSLQFTGNSAATQVVSVAFGQTLSSAPDKIQVTVKGPVSSSSSYVPTVTNSTTEGCTVNVYRIDGSGTQTINLVWSVVS